MSIEFLVTMWSNVHVSSLTVAIKTNYNLPSIYHPIVLVMTTNYWIIYTIAEYVVLLEINYNVDHMHLLKYLRTTFEYSERLSSSITRFIVPHVSLTELVFPPRPRHHVSQDPHAHDALHYNKLLSPAVRGWRGRRWRRSGSQRSLVEGQWYVWSDRAKGKGVRGWLNPPETVIFHVRS